MLQRLFVTESMYRLPACLDDRARVYPERGDFTVVVLATGTLGLGAATFTPIQSHEGLLMIVSLQFF